MGTWRDHEYEVSTDKRRLDIEKLHILLLYTYWAKDRPKEIIKKAVENSLCFGLYKSNDLIGFARVVTDYSTFSWVCDVVISPEFRGLGLGKWLISCVVAHDAVSTTTSILGTEDAHGLYEQFNYHRHELMRRLPSVQLKE